MRQVTLGGERLGGGKKNKVLMHGFERSTHNLSCMFKTTMSPGTLVPFYNELALPGDTHDIELDVDVLTMPTVGPLFGSFKIHLDMFFAPIRLYNAQLHQNKLGIGMNMSLVYLPQMLVEGNVPVMTAPLDNQHVNPSALLKYLGISGVGYKATTPNDRRFNATTLLAYWDIYKNYYANKQEVNGAMIHINPQPTNPTPTAATLVNANPGGAVPVGAAPIAYTVQTFNSNTYLQVTFTAGQLSADFQITQLLFDCGSVATPFVLNGSQIFSSWLIDVANNRLTGTGPLTSGIMASGLLSIGRIRVNANYQVANLAPTIYRFPLANIDNMRNNILSANPAGPYIIPTTWAAGAPHAASFQNFQTSAGPPVVKNYSMMFPQEGLGLRTYSSDLFNNWVDTSLIDGVNGITAVTSVNVVANKFTIDELNLSKKVYEMLNRIAISGGSYDDWLDAVYTHERQRSIESPVYLGGMLSNLVFQEVISTAATEGEALGTLAGRGRRGGISKGGKITVKVDEPGYIMGIVSLVPNIEYSQGNAWDVNLKTMNDLHKPGLDEIGFQNLITDQMAWWDTLNVSGTNQTFRSAGKQPAWINYMTNVNKVYGNFADENQQMFMVLNRRYNPIISGGNTRIEDLTTYIDPSKFNHIFADVRLDAMNFWVQIGIQNTARRKMSAKVIPNL